MGNDADLGAMAEHARGAGAGTGNMIYVMCEVGVGGGMIVDGRPLSGAAGYAGEIGHIVVNPDGHACRCGGRGCLETEVGEWALLRHAGRVGGSERETVDAILREAAAGSRRALHALDLVGTWLGIGLATLVNVFNPSRIVLGGMFTRAYPYIADAVRRELDTHAQANSRAVVTVLPALLGEHSSLIGAAELALEPVLTDPASLPLVGEAAG
jgi:predicted NBD/HSP70 family sugar kinase